MVTSANNPHAATGRSNTAKRRPMSDYIRRQLEIQTLTKIPVVIILEEINFKPILQTLTVYKGSVCFGNGRHLLDIINKTDVFTSFQRYAWQLCVLSFRFKASKLYLFAIFLTSDGTLCEEVFCQLMNI